MHILALHGFTGVGTDFAPFAKLCGGTWHCPDLPGHGPEPLLDCTPKATLNYIDSQASFLRSQVSGFRSQPSTLNLQASTLNVLLGYSMGARAALQHACKYPDAWDALILISPNPGLQDEAEREERRAVDEKLARRIEREGVETFIEFWQNTPMIRSQQRIRADWREAMQLNRRQHTAAGLAASLRQFGQGSCPNLWPELEKLTRPTLLITGSEDLKYTGIAERMEATLSTRHAPPPTRIVVSEAGHMPHLEQAEATARTVRDFINQVIQPS